MPMKLCTMITHRLPFHAHIPALTINKRSYVAVPVVMTVSPETRSRTAKLSARRKERVLVPENISGDGSGREMPISEFLSHPKGIESLLNTRTLQSFELLDSKTYRCKLQKIQFLKFEVAPVLDLQVIPTNEDCTVEMTSCRFEGSKAVEKQNQFFSAFMRNRIKWEAENSKTFLIVDAYLDITLEVYTKPFTMLPLSTVEKPGNLLMQGLLDRFVPLLVEQLLTDYRSWVNEELKVSA